jgi:hypothetical protein
MTLPVGGANIGAGDWGAGVIVPIGFNIGHDVQLSLSPEIDAAANETGRHLASSSVVSLSRPLAGERSAIAEIQVLNDDDLSGVTRWCEPPPYPPSCSGKNTQLDFGNVAGLDRNSPDIKPYFCIARRF